MFSLREKDLVNQAAFVERKSEPLGAAPLRAWTTEVRFFQMIEADAFSIWVWVFAAWLIALAQKPLQGRQVAFWDID